MKIGILGYGNLGHGAELAAIGAKDVTLVGIFTRRDPGTLKSVSGAPIYPAASAAEYQGEIDVMLLCGGSASDLPEQTPELARFFNVVDSFDTHAKIPEHFAKVDRAAKEGEKTALISAGWDPGLFSLARLLFHSVLPSGTEYTFWGPGVSEGHSEAIRRIPGVRDARALTIPDEDLFSAVRRGEMPEFCPRRGHRRKCLVVAEAGADRARIEKEIRCLPNYFAGAEVTVSFVCEEELRCLCTGLSHGGSVFCIGSTGVPAHRQTAELRLRLDSNAEYTGAVLLAFARAVFRMHGRGERGCKTVLEVAPADLSPLTPERLRKLYL